MNFNLVVITFIVFLSAFVFIIVEADIFHHKFWIMCILPKGQNDEKLFQQPQIRLNLRSSMYTEECIRKNHKIYDV